MSDAPSTTQASWSVFAGPEHIGRIVRRLTPAASHGASVGDHLRRMAARVKTANGWFEAFDLGGHSVGIFHSKSEAALALKATIAPFGGPCLICGSHECDDREACALEEMRQARRAVA